MTLYVYAIHMNFISLNFCMSAYSNICYLLEHQKHVNKCLFVRLTWGGAVTMRKKEKKYIYLK